jgi:nucleoside-diphosphate-sugar epimerase
MPKPKSLDKYGYIDGFIKSSNNIFNLCRNISFKKFITISSTRVYGEKENNYLTEDKASPNEYRGDLILKYEDSQKERYAQKLVVLRFSGLYDSLAKDKPLNHLHRDNAAKIIKFFIEKDFNYLTPEVFNCSEDASMNVSNKKLKKAGFIFN